MWAPRSRRLEYSRAKSSRAVPGRPFWTSSIMAGTRARTWVMPFGKTIPNSANRPQSWFACAVRAWTKPWRTLCKAITACRSTVLIGTKRMLGRETASQMASASRASVLVGLYMGLHELGRDELHGVAKWPQLTRPKVSARASLHPIYPRPALGLPTGYRLARFLPYLYVRSAGRVALHIDMSVFMLRFVFSVMESSFPRHYLRNMTKCLVLQ